METRHHHAYPEGEAGAVGSVWHEADLPAAGHHEDHGEGSPTPANRVHGDTAPAE